MKHVNEDPDKDWYYVILIAKSEYYNERCER